MVVLHMEVVLDQFYLIGSCLMALPQVLIEKQAGLQSCKQNVGPSSAVVAAVE